MRCINLLFAYLLTLLTYLPSCGRRTARLQHSERGALSAAADVARERVVRWDPASPWRPRPPGADAPSSLRCLHLHVQQLLAVPVSVRHSSAVGRGPTSATGSLLCRWTSSLEPSADGPRTAGLVIQPLKTLFIWSVGPKGSVKPPSNYALEILSLFL